ncbi:hypothetical protein [Paenibacillus sp. 2TAB19]|uniref:hypothetical protein n=1 Tax=Paenibacillus sp. 2TAB19 TaxID=3233003 RepID=UPI003F982E48
MLKFRTISVAVILIAALAVAGCSSNDNETNIVPVDEPKQAEDNRAMEGKSVTTRVVASEKVLPEDFNEASFRREIAPHYEYMATKSTDETQYEKAWNYYRFEEKQPEVNHEQNDTYFIGVHESGTCPYETGEVSLRADGQALVVMLVGTGSYCTADARPRTFVIELNKEQSKAIREVVIIESDTETIVPLSDVL